MEKEFRKWMRILGYADWEQEEMICDILNCKINWEFDEKFLTYLREVA